MKFFSIKVSLALLAGIAVVGAGYYFTRSEEILADTHIAKRQTIVQEVSVTGTVKSVKTADLAFERIGRVVSVPVRVGDRVYSGQILVEQDAGEILAELRQARANLEAEAARLADLRAGTRIEEISVYETKVANSEKSLADAKLKLISTVRDAFIKADDAIRNRVDQFFDDPRTPFPKISYQITDQGLKGRLERDRSVIENILIEWAGSIDRVSLQGDIEIFAETADNYLGTIKSFLTDSADAVSLFSPVGGLTQTTIDTHRSDVSTARTNINTAILNLVSATESLNSSESALVLAKKELVLKKAGATAEQLAAQEAALKQAEARISIIESQLAVRSIRAPFAGTVTKQDGKIGEIVAANIPLVSLISDGGFEVEAFIPEADVAKIKIGDSARMSLDAYSGDTLFNAKVGKIDPAETVIEGVSTYKTTLELLDKNGRILPGMTANVIIMTNRKDDVMAIPIRAVLTKNGSRIVRLLKDNAIQEVPVEIGLRGSDGFVEIVSGIADGDEVVLFIESD